MVLLFVEREFYSIHVPFEPTYVQMANSKIVAVRHGIVLRYCCRYCCDLAELLAETASKKRDDSSTAATSPIVFRPVNSRR